MKRTPIQQPPPEGGRLLPLALGAAAFVLYLPSLGNGLTNWDDPHYVLANPAATRGLAGIGQALFQPFDGAWYPLTQVAYCLIQAIAGSSPFAHHLAQALVFAAAVALVPAALATFGVPRAAGAIAALLWAAHPLRVESVAWAANLKDALMALCVVGAFALHPRNRRASALAFGAALLAKSAAFPLAGLFLLLERRRGGWKQALRRSAPWWIPSLAIALVAAGLHAQGGEGRHHPGGSLLGAIPTALWLPWWYLGRTLLPLAPRPIHAFEAVGWLDLRLLAALVLWGAAAAALLRTRRHGWFVPVAAWLLPLAPVVGLAPLAHPVADRYTLLPSLVLAAGAGLLLVRYVRPPALRHGIAAASVLVLGAGSLAAQPMWRDAVALWEATLPHAPAHFSVRFNLGQAYAAEGRWDEALAELREARRIDPAAHRAFASVVMVHGVRLGVPGGALEAWRRSLEQAAFADGAIGGVAAAAAEQGQVAFARALLGEAGESASLLAARARVAVFDSSWQEALDAARAARRLDPRLDAPLVDEAIALVELGRRDEALAIIDGHVADPVVRRRLEHVRAVALQDP